MAYKQLKDANIGIQYTGGWCLNAVQRAFGAPWSGASATDAWYNRTTYKHTDIPPLGITVPIYFDGLNGEPAGHVAIRLDDGTVASSTLAGTHNGLYIHPNIEHLLQVYRNYGYTGIRYLGWAEDIGGMRVVQEESLPAHWRKTRLDNINFRTEPRLGAPVRFNEYPAGSTIEMAGYVHGEHYSGSDIWFKTKVSGIYAWSGTMTNSSTDGLSDLTPPKVEAKPAEQPKEESKPAETASTGRYLPDLQRYTFLVDISRYQDFGDAEFIKMRDAGVDGLIISAGTTGPSYGGTKVIVGTDVKSDSMMSNGEYEFGITPSHQKQVDLARKYGFAVGHYFYVYQSLDPIRQARVFAKADILKDGEPLFIDAEEKDLTQDWINAFAAELKKLTGKNGIYYDYTSNVKAKGIKNISMWLADYTHEPYKFGNVEVDVIMHQYTSSGRIPGVEADLDFNATPYSIDDFTLLGTIDKTPTEAPKEDETPTPPQDTKEPSSDVEESQIPKVEVEPEKEKELTEMEEQIKSAALSAWKVDGTRKNAIKSASKMVGRLATQVIVSGVIAQGILAVVAQGLPSIYATLPKESNEYLTVIVLIIAVFAAQYGYKLDKFKWPF